MRLRQGLKEKGFDHSAARLRENVTPSLIEAENGNVAELSLRGGVPLVRSEGFR